MVGRVLLRRFFRSYLVLERLNVFGDVKNVKLLSYCYSRCKFFSTAPEQIQSQPEDSASGGRKMIQQTWKEINNSDVQLVWDDNDTTGRNLGFTSCLSSEADSFVRSFLAENCHRTISFDEWDELRRKCVNMSPRKEAAERLVDSSFFLIVASNDDWLKSGLSYVDYLTNKNLFNPASVRVASTLIYRMYLLGRLPVDDRTVLALINATEKFNEFGEGNQLATFVCLCCTSRWKRCLKMLPNFKSSRVAVSRFAVACFNNDEANLGLNVLQRFADQNGPYTLTRPVLNAFFDCLLRMSENREKRGESMNLFVKFAKVTWTTKLCGIHPIFESKLRQFFKKFDDRVKLDGETTVTQRGFCKSCDARLEPYEITTQELETMKDMCWNQLLGGKHVYSATTPMELRYFTKLVDANKPFDVIVDGLNILYQRNFRNPALAPSVCMEKLTNVLNQLQRRKFRNILLILKNHIFHGHPQCVAELRKAAHICSVDNHSTDDSFALYAAFSSGPNCYVVSHDKFNFIREICTNQLQFTFARWRRVRVIVPETLGKKITLHMPPRYDLRIHVSGDGIHVPLVGPYIVESNASIDLPGEPWFCVKKKTNC